MSYYGSSGPHAAACWCNASAAATAGGAARLAATPPDGAAEACSGRACCSWLSPCSSSAACCLATSASPPPCRRRTSCRRRANTFASTQIYDREGNLLNEIADPSVGRRTLVRLDEISPFLVKATIATEDPNFYQHPGVDPVGMCARRVLCRQASAMLSSGPGGSTITQQLVKLTFLSPERTVTRKVKEAILAAEITRRYSKDTILQIYLNEIYYGNLAYGIEAASQTYFGKPAKDLTLAEAAMLAGLPQAPAYYDPYTSLWEADGVTPGAVKRRQGAVLSLMVKNGDITAAAGRRGLERAAQVAPLAAELRRRSTRTSCCTCATRWRRSSGPS